MNHRNNPRFFAAWTAVLSSASGLLAQTATAPATASTEEGRWLVDFFKDPIQIGFVVGIGMVLLALYSINRALTALRETLAPETVKAPKAAPAWYTSLMKGATKATPIEREADVMLDHDYDGIKELDNSLPPWWVWGFYFTIAFSVVYLIRYHLLGEPSSKKEFEIAMAQAKASVEEYRKKAGDAVDETTVVLLTDAGRISAGKKIYESNCVACHAADGGGLVGPNLTDPNWIHGGGIVNVFKTIKYGVPEKGMISWKDQLSPTQMQDVASYVLTFQGTTPAAPKAAEGAVWVDAAGSAPADSTATDSTSTPTDSLSTAAL